MNCWNCQRVMTLVVGILYECRWCRFRNYKLPTETTTSIQFKDRPIAKNGTLMYWEPAEQERHEHRP